jgi:hypothetical protein
MDKLSIISTTIQGFSEFHRFKQKNSQNTRIVVLIMDSLSMQKFFLNFSKFN